MLGIQITLHYIPANMYVIYTNNQHAYCTKIIEDYKINIVNILIKNYTHGAQC